MAFESKRGVPRGQTNNGNGARTHDSPSNGASASAVAPGLAPLDGGVTRYIPTPAAPKDFGREQADKRAESQSLRSLRLRQHLDCEPPWDILRARASFESPASPNLPWPDRFDIWPTDMAGYWPCPICETPLAPVDRTPMKLFRCRTCDTETIVHVKAPVVDCPRHGRHEIELPWRQNETKWTYLGTEPSEH
jgi:ribosomal protein L37AE/L43A